MSRLTSVALLLAVVMLAPARARTLAGVEMPDTVVVDGTTLRLNGMGLREATALRVKAYAAGLYLEHPSSDPSTVIGSPQKKRVTMKFLRDIDHERLSAGWADSLRKAGASDQSVSAFTALIHDVKKGDTMSFTARPGVGVEVAGNGAVRGSLPGDDFTRSLFKVWFGPEPGDPNLKRGMLGT